MLIEPDRFARLVLLRHPQLAEAHQKAVLGQGDAELSRRGREHMLSVMRSLNPIKIDAIFSPPVAHCRSVAEAMTRDRGLEVVLESRLNDQALGEWEGQSWEDVRRRHEALVRDFFTDYGMVAPPGGETLSQAVDRVLSWWAETGPTLESKTSLVVASAPILSAFSARLLGLSIRRGPALSLPPAAYGILDVYRDGAVLRCWHPMCVLDAMP